MSDDIVTKLEFLLKEGAAIIKDQADEIEHLQNKISILIELGNTLAKEVEIGGRCACRREWVCFKCQALEAWKKACEDS